MLEALKNIDCEFLMGGLFDDEVIKERIIKSPFWQKVNYFGFVNRIKANEIYSVSKVGLVTLHPIINYIDALPVKMFEYMSAGLPVIASNFPLWKEIIEGNKCGICVDPLRPNEIAEAIQYLLSNDEIAEEMGNNGRAAVLNKYNWDSEENKLIAIYKSL
jgi:glycosyltransferase involved in cell wall biosynthesis